MDIRVPEFNPRFPFSLQVAPRSEQVLPSTDSKTLPGTSTLAHTESGTLGLVKVVGEKQINLSRLSCSIHLFSLMLQCNSDILYLRVGSIAKIFILNSLLTYTWRQYQCMHDNNYCILVLWPESIKSKNCTNWRNRPLKAGVRAFLILIWSHKIGKSRSSIEI